MAPLIFQSGCNAFAADAGKAGGAAKLRFPGLKALP